MQDSVGSGPNRSKHSKIRPFFSIILRRSWSGEGGSLDVNFLARTRVTTLYLPSFDSLSVANELSRAEMSHSMWSNSERSVVRLKWPTLIIRLENRRCRMGVRRARGALSLFVLLIHSGKKRGNSCKNLLKFWHLRGAKDCKSCRPRKMLKNEYLVAKIGFDTAENEPSKVWRNFAKILNLERCEGLQIL